jgi:formylglycine-generating enzyme required for sulfatase activity
MPLTLIPEIKTACFYPQLLGKSTLEMVSIPRGHFLMGSPEDALERLLREGPLHPVTIESFFISKYPITQAQWAFVADLPQIKLKLESNPAKFKGDSHPVERVAWWDAMEFCDRLSTYTKLPYRLPSEAEWEYACRAGTNTPFHFGQTLTDKLSNYDASRVYNETGVKGKVSRSTTPVGQFPANAFGLYDMHGNVWEWCADHWHSNYDRAPIDGSIWLTDDINAPRVLRGGSWIDVQSDCRSAIRDSQSPEVRDDNFGFRVLSSPQGFF